MIAYGSLVIHPRHEGYANTMEALADGVDASKKAVMCMIGATVFAHIASEEFRAFQNTRRSVA